MNWLRMNDPNLDGIPSKKDAYLCHYGVTNSEIVLGIGEENLLHQETYLCRTQLRKYIEVWKKWMGR